MCSGYVQDTLTIIYIYVIKKSAHKPQMRTIEQLLEQIDINKIPQPESEVRTCEKVVYVLDGLTLKSYGLYLRLLRVSTAVIDRHNRRFASFLGKPVEEVSPETVAVIKRSGARIATIRHILNASQSLFNSMLSLSVPVEFIGEELEVKRGFKMVVNTKPTVDVVIAVGTYGPTGGKVIRFPGGYKPGKG